MIKRNVLPFMKRVRIFTLPRRRNRYGGALNVVKS